MCASGLLNADGDLTPVPLKYSRIHTKKDSVSSLSDNESSATDQESLSSGERTKKFDHYSPIFPSAKSLRKQAPTLNIAFVGGGGMACITAALLSNITRYYLDANIIITIIERNKRIISGSSFEAAAMLHIDGREYPTDAETAKECQMTGELYPLMFPELYSDESDCTLFVLGKDAALSPETQKATHQQAKRSKYELRNIAREHSDSQTDVPEDFLKDHYGDDHTSCIMTKKDRPSKVFQRDAYLRKFLKNAPNVKIKTNHTVFRIRKEQNNKFSIIYATSEIDLIQYDHVFLTAWDQSDSIRQASLEASLDLMKTLPQFIAEDRVLALCDISTVPPLLRNTIFKLDGGGMFTPLNHKIGLAYRCMNGASYPKTGRSEIYRHEAHEHGQIIIDEIKKFYKKEGEGFFSNITLLGERLQKIVRKIGPLEVRRYEPPMVTPEGVIIATPPKATFIPALALQSIEQFLLQLPQKHAVLRETWIPHIKAIIPNNQILNTGNPLHEAFVIRNQELTAISEIDDEVRWYLEHCTLTGPGEELLATYTQQSGCFPEVPALRRCMTIHEDSRSDIINIDIGVPDSIIRSISSDNSDEVKLKQSTIVEWKINSYNKEDKSRINCKRKRGSNYSEPNVSYDF